jgi:hypothetical protein
VEIKDAVAGVVYKKTLAHPDKFPTEIVSAVHAHAEYWGVNGDGWNTIESEMWKRLLLVLERFADSLPAILGENDGH